jgi:hypothetical protein
VIRFIDEKHFMRRIVGSKQISGSEPDGTPIDTYKQDGLYYRYVLEMSATLTKGKAFYVVCDTLWEAQSISYHLDDPKAFITAYNRRLKLESM